MSFLRSKIIKWLDPGRAESGFDYSFFQNLPTEFAIFDLNGKYKFANSKYISDPQIREKIVGKSFCHSEQF